MRLYPHAFLALLCVLQRHLSTVDGFVSCQTACQECLRAYESLDLLEVYCSMCKQCRDNRRQNTKYSLDHARKNLKRTQEDKTVKRLIAAPKSSNLEDFVPTTRRIFYLRRSATKTGSKNDLKLIENWPADCPTPPICSDDESIEMLTQPVPVKSTTTRTTTAKPKPTCPPVPTCKPKKRTTSMPPCVPCMPMCFMPCYGNFPGNRHQNEQKYHKSKKNRVRKSTTKEFVKETTGLISIKTDVTTPVGGLRFRDFNFQDPSQLRQQHYENFENGGQNFQNGAQNGGNSPDYYYMYLGIPKNDAGFL